MEAFGKQELRMSYAIGDRVKTNVGVGTVVVCNRDTVKVRLDDGYTLVAGKSLVKRIGDSPSDDG